MIIICLTVQFMATTILARVNISKDEGTAVNSTLQFALNLRLGKQAKTTEHTE